MYAPFIIGDLDAQLVHACRTYDDRIKARVGVATMNMSTPKADEAVAASSSTKDKPRLTAPTDSVTHLVASSSSSAITDDGSRKKKPFPLDYSALFYQSRVRITLAVPTGALQRWATSTQKALVKSYITTADGLGLGDVEEETPTSDVASACGYITVDTMTLHRLLLPPSFEDEEVSKSGGTVDASLFGRALWEGNFDGLLKALFPLTIAGKAEVAAMADGVVDNGNTSSATPSFISISGWKALRYDSHITDRFSYSYGCLLAYYGWRLHDEASGEVDRHKDWRARYEQLRPTATVAKGTTIEGEKQKKSPPSPYLAITHVIQCLLELKLFPLVAKLLLFLLEEFKADRLRWLVEKRGGWVGAGEEGGALIARVVGLVAVDSIAAYLPSDSDDAHHQQTSSEALDKSKAAAKLIDPASLSLFDDVWFPMLANFQHLEGNSYDANGDVERIRKRRASLDASDSE